jgi:hypothetical protein
MHMCILISPPLEIATVRMHCCYLQMLGILWSTRRGGGMNVV